MADTRAVDPGAAEQDGKQPKSVRVVLLALMVTMMLAMLDNMIVGTAMPTIVGELGGLEHLSWVVTAYTLATAASTPLWGKLGDMYGRKGVFMASIVLFLIGSALSGMAQDMGQLIAFRAVQGLGAGRSDGRRHGDHRRSDSAAGAGQVPGHDGRRDGARDDRRAAGRWHHHRPLGLALGVLHQPAARGRGARRDQCRPASAEEAGAGADRLSGCGAADGGHHRDRAGHHLGRYGVRLDLRDDHGAHRRSGSRRWSGSCSGRPRRPSRWCRCTSSAAATSR